MWGSSFLGFVRVYKAIGTPCYAEWSECEVWGSVSRVMYVWVGVVQEMWLSMCCRSFLRRLREMAGDVPLVSLVMTVWSVVRMCVRSSRARDFSLDTR
jgi:hypothetical protein